VNTPGGDFSSDFSDDFDTGVTGVATNRGQVMTALATVLSSMTFPAAINGSTTWRTFEQRLRLWGDVPVEQQPYMALVTHLEMDEYRNLGLLRRRLDLRAWCYSRTDGGVIGQVDLDVMMQGFETALQPDDPSRNTFTLGGLVYWCRIEGRVFKDPGDIDNQALLLVPIVVEWP
jgi:hypothetical protein